MVRMIGMMNMTRGWLPWVTRSQKGAVAVEYALIVTFVAVLIVAGATVFGGAVSGWFNSMSGVINGWGNTLSGS